MTFPSFTTLVYVVYYSYLPPNYCSKNAVIAETDLSPWNSTLFFSSPSYLNK
jgi:hypothetical protein